MQAGVPTTTLLAAEESLFLAATTRGSAESQLLSVASPPPSLLSLDALSAAIEIARGVGVSSVTTESAQSKRDSVAAQRVEAELRLEFASAQSPSEVHLLALQRAIESARTAGVAEPLVCSAEARWARLAATREAAKSKLLQVASRPAGVFTAELDRAQLTRAMSFARAAGVPREQMDSAEARWQSLRLGTQMQHTLGWYPAEQSEDAAGPEWRNRAQRNCIQ